MAVNGKQRFKHFAMANTSVAASDMSLQAQSAESRFQPLMSLPVGLASWEANEGLLRAALRRRDHDAVHAIFSDARMCGGREVAPFAFEDLSKQYTRNLIAINDDFALMVLVWRPGAVSPIHAHEGSGCWVKIVQGALVEDVFEGEGACLDKAASTCLGVGGCAYIDDSVGVHSMRNASSSAVAISVHLYSPPFAKCDTFVPAANGAIDVREGRMAFDTVFGRRRA